MTLEQVRHVLEVEKAKSINQAANNMFLSQSALSLSIKALEQEFGQDIFIRNSKGVALTPFGRTFISYVRPIQLQINQLYSLRKGNAARHMLSLKVASNGFRFVSSVLAQIYQKYKSMGIRIENFDCVGDDALDMVSDKLVEIGVIRFWSCYKPLYYKQFEAKSLQFFSMAKKPLCVLVGRGSPLYTLEQNSISAEELAGYPMVMHDYMDCGPYSDILDRLGLAWLCPRIALLPHPARSFMIYWIRQTRIISARISKMSTSIWMAGLGTSQVIAHICFFSLGPRYSQRSGGSNTARIIRVHWQGNLYL